MEKTEKFFIFTWKELMVIVLLILTLVGFFFTLGLHYGKKIGGPAEHASVSDGDEKLEESPEELPPRENLETGSHHEKAVSSETITEATKAEVAESGVKVDQPKAVALPSEKAAPRATHEHETEKAEAPEAKVEPRVVYSVQLGSYVTKKEAQAKVRAFSGKGVSTEIVTAEVNHQTRFRVVIPGFKTKLAADQRGKDLKQKHKIESFIVIK